MLYARAKVEDLDAFNKGNAKAVPSSPRLPKEDTNLSSLSTTLRVPL
jgi:hypothetical protein